MILTGPEIQNKVEQGEIKVDPFVEEHIGSNSLDLRLSQYLKIYVDKDGTPVRRTWERAWGLYPKFNQEHNRKRKEYLYKKEAFLNTKRKPRIKSLKIPDSGFIMEPSIGYLGSTIESVDTGNFVTEISGRSSIGRLFLEVHKTAGLGDMGFDGSWTLEMDCLSPVKVYPGMRICQISFFEPTGDHYKYGDKETSKYQGQTKPMESQIYQDFEEYGD